MDGWMISYKIMALICRWKIQILNLFKSKTSQKDVNLHIWKLVNIPTITMQQDSTLYYILIQTLNFPFVLIWFCFLLFFFRGQLVSQFNPHVVLLICDFFSKECALPFACGEFQFFHFGGSNFHYQFISKWFSFLHYAQIICFFLQLLHFFELSSY